MLFPTDEKIASDKVFSNEISDVTKHIIANSVYAGCMTCREIMSSPEALGIPRCKYFDTASSIGFFINRIAAQYIDDNNFADLKYYEKTVGHGRPMVLFESGRVVFHIKKNRNSQKLPPRSNLRVNEAQENKDAFLVLPGFEQPKTIYMIVTFNHKNFQLKYVQIGMADAEYNKWLNRWSLVDYIQKDRAEEMNKEYKSDLAEQAEAIIRKEYRLEMRH